MEFICQEVAHDSKAYWETVSIRDAVLRQPLNMEFSKEELVAENDSHHLAVYNATGEMLACLILKPLDTKVIKMRQVATTTEHQGKGAGKALVLYSEQFAWQKGFQTISLHARIGAVPFYEKLGYYKMGTPFDEVGIQHYKMMKEQSNIAV